MKRLAVTVWILATAVAPAWAQGSGSAAGVEDKSRQILEQTVQALGGPAYLNVQDMVREGRIYGFDRGELSSPGDRFINYVKFKGKERIDFGKKGQIVYLNSNDEGWELDKQGVRDMTPESIETFQEGLRRDLDYVLRFRLQEERVQLYYVGTEFVDNRRAHAIEMVDDRQESLVLYIDARTYLPMQIRYRHRDVLSGEFVELIEYYGKWVSVQGIQTPMAISRERAGQRYFEVYMTSVKYNAGVDDALFTRASLEERWAKVK
ncbi:MAG: hypothetical protein L0212_06765 [Acidobacteria bacterium]|nr:hypothetical protein [Acidobacteriota bacterium]